MSRVRLGFMPLTDCAVLAMAVEKGFFRRHGVDVTLSREASWASMRDKVAVGALDGAQMLAGMPLAAAAGSDPIGLPLVTAMSLNLNGNAITVSSNLWARMAEADPAAAGSPPMTAGALRRVVEADRRAGRSPLRLAVVYPFATHNYELRYWLAAAGIDPETDVRLSVVPPPRMVEALENGTIDGCCVGEPWNSLAVHAGLGRIVMTKYELWNNSPEKVFAVTEAFAEREPRLHQAMLGALLEAAAWADEPDHRRELASILSDTRYVGAPAPLLAASLTGRVVLETHGDTVAFPDFHVFHRYAANFPWVSHAIWLLSQMARWRQLTTPIDLVGVARRVYRPDLYRDAARAVGISAPQADVKSEGTHAAAWTLPGTLGPITMSSDLFFDGATFNA